MQFDYSGIQIGLGMNVGTYKPLNTFLDRNYQFPSEPEDMEKLGLRDRVQRAKIHGNHLSGSQKHEINLFS